MVEGLNKDQKVIKRLFDLFFAFIGLLVLLLPILILVALATISTGKFGLYSQNRIGLGGKSFVIYKIRSMKTGDDSSMVTLENDPRITRFGIRIRHLRLDELPQLWNVLKGDMSLVGPRPDVAGFADRLRGEDRIILSVRPGITGPATLKFKNEEAILAAQKDPVSYNKKVIWRQKIELNKKYIENWTLKGDLTCILKTLFH